MSLILARLFIQTIRRGYNPYTAVVNRLASTKSYYEVLGVKKTATPSEIRNAFIELCKKHHPDKKYGNAEMFKQVNEAYSVLSRESSKEIYDARDYSGRPFSSFSDDPDYPNFWNSEGPIGQHQFNFRQQFSAKRKKGDIWFIYGLILITLLSYITSGFFFYRRSRSEALDPSHSAFFRAHESRISKRRTEKRPE